MTVREVINTLLDCEMDNEFTVEVRVDAVDADREKGHTWCELEVEQIVVCCKKAVASTKEPY